MREGREQRNFKGWAEIRHKIITRDNYQCRICHYDIEQLYGSLDVHHVDYNYKNNDFYNLVTLCPICHKAVHTENYKSINFMDYPEPWGERKRD